VDPTLADYFAAWNETNADDRWQLLGRCLSDDVELIDPTGRWQGIAGLSERIANYHSSAPGTIVASASGVDEHNGIERYAWKIVDPSGNELMEGLDVAERDTSGRLRRIVMFHGPLPAGGAADVHAQTNSASNLITLGEVTIRYVHAEASSPYSLLEWSAPPGTPSPPVHIHHHTDEGFYVTAGSYAFERDGERLLAPAGSHVLVPQGRAHTFWNAGNEVAVCLIVLAPPGFEAYFRELSAGLAQARSDDEAIELRHRLSASYDIEVVGPPIQTP